MKNNSIVVALFCGTLLISGCSTAPSKQEQGAAAGAVVGGVLGGALGDGHSDRGWAIALGIIFGGLLANLLAGLGFALKSLANRPAQTLRSRD